VPQCCCLGQLLLHFCGCCWQQLIVTLNSNKIHLAVAACCVATAVANTAAMASQSIAIDPASP